MNTKHKHPVINPNCTLVVFLERKRVASAPVMLKGLKALVPLETGHKLKAALSALAAECNDVRKAVTAQTKLYLPELLNPYPPAADADKKQIPIRNNTLN